MAPESTGNGIPEMAIEVKGISKIFGSGSSSFTALDHVDVDIGRNEFFTLLGPSGCGKTTLLRLIAGFEEPTAGSIKLDGKDIGELPPYRRPVNTVFQNYSLFPHMTVSQNIAFGLQMLRRPRAEIDQTVDEMLSLVKMSALADRRVSAISGGQQQRVALARALAPKPRVLLLDEPLSALDLQLRKEMQLELKRLQLETGITFIFVTHDQEEALTMSDRIAVLNEGKILQIGGPREIYNFPRHRFVASFIGEINLVTADLAKSASGECIATLRGAGEISLEGAGIAAGGSSATLAIRPECIELNKTSPNTLGGRLTNIVYHGNDTIFHIQLPDGQSIRARQQNRTKIPEQNRVGDEISWSVTGQAVSVVEE